MAKCVIAGTPATATRPYLLMTFVCVDCDGRHSFEPDGVTEDEAHRRAAILAEHPEYK